MNSKFYVFWRKYYTHMNQHDGSDIEEVIDFGLWPNEFRSFEEAKAAIEDRLRKMYMEDFLHYDNMDDFTRPGGPLPPWKRVKASVPPVPHWMVYDYITGGYDDGTGRNFGFGILELGSNGCMERPSRDLYGEED